MMNRSGGGSGAPTTMMAQRKRGRPNMGKPQQQSTVASRYLAAIDCSMPAAAPAGHDQRAVVTTTSSTESNGRRLYRASRSHHPESVSPANTKTSSRTADTTVDLEHSFSSGTTPNRSVRAEPSLTPLRSASTTTAAAPVTDVFVELDDDVGDIPLHGPGNTPGRPMNAVAAKTRQAPASTTHHVGQSTWKPPNAGGAAKSAAPKKSLRQHTAASRQQPRSTAIEHKSLESSSIETSSTDLAQRQANHESINAYAQLGRSIDQGLELFLQGAKSWTNCSTASEASDPKAAAPSLSLSRTWSNASTEVVTNTHRAMDQALRRIQALETEETRQALAEARQSVAAQREVQWYREKGAASRALFLKQQHQKQEREQNEQAAVAAAATMALHQHQAIEMPRRRLQQTFVRPQASLLQDDDTEDTEDDIVREATPSQEISNTVNDVRTRRQQSGKYSTQLPMLTTTQQQPHQQQQPPPTRLSFARDNRGPTPTRLEAKSILSLEDSSADDQSSSHNKSPPVPIMHKNPAHHSASVPSGLPRAPAHHNSKLNSHLMQHQHASTDKNINGPEEPVVEETETASTPTLPSSVGVEIDAVPDESRMMPHNRSSTPALSTIFAHKRQQQQKFVMATAATTTNSSLQQSVSGKTQTTVSSSEQGNSVAAVMNPAEVVENGTRRKGHQLREADVLSDNAQFMDTSFDDASDDPFGGVMSGVGSPKSSQQPQPASLFMPDLKAGHGNTTHIPHTSSLAARGAIETRTFSVKQKSSRQPHEVPANDSAELIAPPAILRRMTPVPVSTTFVTMEAAQRDESMEFVLPGSKHLEESPDPVFCSRSQASTTLSHSFAASSVAQAQQKEEQRSPSRMAQYLRSRQALPDQAHDVPFVSNFDDSMGEEKKEEERDVRPTEIAKRPLEFRPVQSRFARKLPEVSTKISVVDDIVAEPLSLRPQNGKDEYCCASDTRYCHPDPGDFARDLERRRFGPRVAGSSLPTIAKLTGMTPTIAKATEPVRTMRKRPGKAASAFLAALAKSSKTPLADNLGSDESDQADGEIAKNLDNHLKQGKATKKTDDDEKSLDVQSLKSALEVKLSKAHQGVTEEEEEDDDTASVKSIRERYETPVEEPESEVSKRRAMFEHKKPPTAMRKFATGNSSLKQAFSKFEGNATTKKPAFLAAKLRSSAVPRPNLRREDARKPVEPSSGDTEKKHVPIDSSAPMSVKDRIRAFAQGIKSSPPRPSASPVSLQRTNHVSNSKKTTPRFTAPVTSQSKPSISSDDRIKVTAQRDETSSGKTPNLVMLANSRPAVSREMRPGIDFIDTPEGHRMKKPSKSDAIDPGLKAADLADEAINEPPETPSKEEDVHASSKSTEDQVESVIPLVSTKQSAQNLDAHLHSTNQANEAPTHSMSVSQKWATRVAVHAKAAVSGVERAELWKKESEGAFDHHVSLDEAQLSGPTWSGDETEKPAQAVDVTEQEDESMGSGSNFSDGVTLDLSIAEVSNLTNPTALISKAETTQVEEEDDSSSTKSSKSPDIVETDAKRSEASSSQTSEAAAPLIARALRMNPMSDELSMGESFFSGRARAIINRSRTPVSFASDRRSIDSRSNGRPPSRSSDWAKFSVSSSHRLSSHHEDEKKDDSRNGRDFTRVQSTFSPLDSKPKTFVDFDPEWQTFGARSDSKSLSPAKERQAVELTIPVLAEDEVTEQKRGSLSKRPGSPLSPRSKTPPTRNTSKSRQTRSMSELNAALSEPLPDTKPSRARDAIGGQISWNRSADDSLPLRRVRGLNRDVPLPDSPSRGSEASPRFVSRPALNRSYELESPPQIAQHPLVRVRGNLEEGDEAKVWQNDSTARLGISKSPSQYTGRPSQYSPPRSPTTAARLRSTVAPSAYSIPLDDALTRDVTKPTMVRPQVRISQGGARKWQSSPRSPIFSRTHPRRTDVEPTWKRRANVAPNKSPTSTMPPVVFNMTIPTDRTTPSAARMDGPLRLPLTARLNKYSVQHAALLTRLNALKEARLRRANATYNADLVLPDDDAKTPMLNDRLRTARQANINLHTTDESSSLQSGSTHSSTKFGGNSFLASLELD